jgi:hypothetical protein
MKKHIYLLLPVAVALVALCFLPASFAKAQNSADLNARSQKINEQSQRLLDEQADRSKRIETLLCKQEDLMKRQEEAFKHYEKILETWDKQQQQYQRYLDTLPKK